MWAEVLDVEHAQTWVFIGHIQVVSVSLYLLLHSKWSDITSVELHILLSIGATPANAG